MSRRRTKISLTQAQEDQLEALLRSETKKKSISRLIVIRAAAIGTNTYEDLAQIAGMSRTGVFRCLTAFEEGGFDGLLEREKPPVRPSPIHDDALVEAVGAELEKGTFRTAAQAQAWLLKNYGIDRSLPTLYRWLKKCGAALLVPRPVHIKPKYRYCPTAAQLDDSLITLWKATSYMC